MGFLGMDFVCFWMEISFDCGVFDEDCERCMFMMYLKALKASSVEIYLFKACISFKATFPLAENITFISIVYFHFLRATFLLIFKS